MRAEFVLSGLEGGAPLNRITHCIQDTDNPLQRCARGCQQKRGGTAAGMITADGLKGFRRSLHAVTTQSAVHVKVNEARGQVISSEIKNLTGPRMASFADCVDFSIFNDELKAITNPIGKNQTRVAKNHFAERSVFGVQHST